MLEADPLAGAWGRAVCALIEPGCRQALSVNSYLSISSGNPGDHVDSLCRGEGGERPTSAVVLPSLMPLARPLATPEARPSFDVPARSGRGDV